MKCNEHDIEYTDEYCPACILEDRIEELNEEISFLERRIRRLQIQLEELND